MEEQVDQYQDDCRNAENPRQEIFAHDRAPFKVVVEYGSIVPWARTIVRALIHDARVRKRAGFRTGLQWPGSSYRFAH
jgi:hypothetical protein